MNSTSKISLLTFVLLAICVPVRAMDTASVNAKTRAALYQAEVRAELTKHQWHVAAEASGVLVLDHMLLNQEASLDTPNGKSGYTRAVITFKPKSTKDTVCSASVLNYVDGYYRTADVKKYHGHVPTRSAPETVQAVEKLINEARVRLLDTHPEYGLSPH